MQPHFNSQEWNEDTMNKVSACRKSCMNTADIQELRKRKQMGYNIKFPKSTGMFDVNVFRRTTGEFLSFNNFNTNRHQDYATRSMHNSNYLK